MAEYCLIYSVFPDAEQAKKVAKILLAEKLIACANILPAHVAMYEWEGKLCEESENIMILKTIAKNFAAVQARVLELHSYDLPCVLEVEVKNGNADFLKWIGNSVKDVINP